MEKQDQSRELVKGQKRLRDQEDVPDDALSQQPSKRRRSLQTHTVPEHSSDNETITSKGLAQNLEESNGIVVKTIHPVQHWIETSQWPKEYFERYEPIQEESEEDSTYMEQPQPVVVWEVINGVRYPRPTPILPTIRRKRSDSSLISSEENKTNKYRDVRYASLLEAKGSYIRDIEDYEPPEEVENLFKTLLESNQPVPEDSLFHDDIFKKVCANLQGRNEARIMQDIARLVVPSAEALAVRGATHLKLLTENVNEAWTASIPVEGPRPQPDYSVGFKRSAFTDEQLRTFDPILGTAFDTSYFGATYRMLFPFLTCEVKGSAGSFDVADKQNAHSMTVAARSIVELYRLVGREQELDRRILAFSISHDHHSVGIYGHYPVIKNRKATYYRHTIHSFDFTALGGRDKWTAYQFTKNVYDIWMPTHLKLICSVIDQLPRELKFGVSLPSELEYATEVSGLSQDLGGLRADQSNPESGTEELESPLDGEPSVPVAATSTPDTSVSHAKGKAQKRAKKAHNIK